MKIHLRFDASDAEHTRFTLFINGANTGQLCMTTEEAVTFHHIVQNGCSNLLDSFVSSGKVYPEKEQ